MRSEHLPQQKLKPLLLVLPTCSSFMDVDKQILRQSYRVKTVHLEQDRSRWRYLKRNFILCLTLFRSPGFKLVVVWFADYHAAPVVLLSRLLGKKTVVFIGGYDAVKYPRLGMGVYCSPLRGFCARLALKNCSLVIANHAALLSSQNTYYDPQGHPEGVYQLIRGLGTPSKVVHNACPIEPEAEVAISRKRQILTVGSTPRLNDFYNKGFDLLLEVAKRRPDLNFVFVGISLRWLPELLRKHQLEALPNLTIHTWLHQPKMLELMRQSSVYAQPSISEGMPNALMEAMALGCVPVGSNVAGIPLIIGEHGFVIDRRDPASLEAALDKALAAQPDRQAISDHIRLHFNRDRRAQRLLEALKEL